uniref:hypothetical protein n=1 Tax=Bacillus wiedmannii TaxID=1890302 RepID=UPI00352AF154
MRHFHLLVSQASDMNYVVLRYFNVAGIKEDDSIGEANNHETHLIMIILQAALGKHNDFMIYGLIITHRM